MKSIKKILLIATIIVFTSFGSFAQLTEPGDGAGGDPTGDHDPIGGSASLESGIYLLIALGAAYGYRKIYQLKAEEV